MARRQQISRVFVHALMDGRDAAPTSGVDHLGRIEQHMSQLGTGRVATICGRYFAMDRDRRWDRTQRAYDAMAAGRGGTARAAVHVLTTSYAAGVTDEFIEPRVIVDAGGRPLGTIQDGDSVLFFNYRADRARQLTRALAFGDEFDAFERRPRPTVDMTTMTEYDATFDLPVAFPPQVFASNVADVLADHGLTNLRLAETEKYAHVTYFFNCGEERPYQGEERSLVPSPKVATYDLEPAMSANEIAGQLVSDVRDRRHNVIICNFANADMVGHTGKLDAAIRAVSVVDTCLASIVRAVEESGGTVVITADHGNAEMMWDRERRGPHTAHTTNPVPILLVEKDLRDRQLSLRRRVPARRGAHPARHPRDPPAVGNERTRSAYLDRWVAGESLFDFLAHLVCRDPQRTEEPSVVGGDVGTGASAWHPWPARPPRPARQNPRWTQIRSRLRAKSASRTRRLEPSRGRLRRVDPRKHLYQSRRPAHVPAGVQRRSML